MNTKNQKRLTDQGFTLAELLIAMAISLVVMSAIFLTFKSQQDSYIIQDQVTAMQQNLRAAMYMLTRDIQMAGYYTNFDTDTYTMDWDDVDDDNDPTTGTEMIRPLIYAQNNVNVAGDNIKDNTDVIVIVKASSNFGVLGANDSAAVNTITLNDLGVGSGTGQIDLNDAGKRFGVMVRSDLSRAEFFEIPTGTGGPPFSTVQSFSQTYGEGDLIFRADVIIYRVDENATNPSLRRRNFGQDNGNYQVVAENIDNLQFRYLLSDGTWTNNPAGQEPNVRAVEISLLARTANTNRGYIDPNTYSIGDVNYNPNDAYRRKLLCSIVKTRNIGL
ncbi:MAG: PilW family protein [Deltaproteobacteria bacterium]|nr:PilW family protein [Deltaproteobacteria bacterium]